MGTRIQASMALGSTATEIIYLFTAFHMPVKMDSGAILQFHFG
jgi:hypothetical protein